MTKPTLFIMFMKTYALFFIYIYPCQAKKNLYTKEEHRFAKVPRIRFHDRRLRKIYNTMSRQYKFMYAHAASDGYILPNEKRELLLHRRHMNRIATVDQRYHRIRILVRKSKKSTKQRKLKKQKVKYETMIRRFACQHIRNYKRKYKNHCK